MGATTKVRWCAVHRGGGVCLALAALACGDGGESTAAQADAAVTTSTSSSGTGGTSGAGGGSTTVSTSTVSGSGGAGGSFTSSTGGGAAGEASTIEMPIPFSYGWAAGTLNAVGVQGSFYTLSDATGGGDSSIEPESFGSGQLCARGSIGQVLPDTDGVPDYETYWGAGISFNLNQYEGSTDALVYDATSHDVVGFSFVIAGSNPLPPEGELRFLALVEGSTHDYCRRVLGAGTNTFLFTDLFEDCWLSDPTLPRPDPTRLTGLMWQYIGFSDESYDFDICITSLSAIVEQR